MISLNWVKDYIDISDQDPKELAVKITKAGVNVEKVISNHIDHLVIGKIVECENHPNSDHLHVCQVDVGEKIIQIVCGAPNARKGIKVIVALPGAVLPENFEIKQGVIRGVESNGMMCALFELGLEKKTEENYNKGIAELSTDLPTGTDANIYLGTNDTVYELDVHKHRNNDCYYHIGFAYEIACILSRKVKLPIISHGEISDSVKNHVDVSVKTDKCPYYLAKMATGVVIKESPDFIKERLVAAGMRSINNVVDISNYVMLEYGQPLHFFDKDKLGNKILVRNATDGERIVTLDGNERELNEKDIVITDGEKPVCIAGVMGGENTEVDENTKTILIESAIFNSVSIRNTAARLDLKSEASIRYGKGLNYEYTQQAIERACALLEKYAGAKILRDTVCVDNLLKKQKNVKFTTSQISDILGLELNDSDVKTELKRLDFPFDFDGKCFNVEIPNRRLDIDENVNDIAEEIGRLYGYQNIKAKLPELSVRQGEYVGDVKIRKEITKRLRTLGLNESKTYTLVSPEMAGHFNYDGKEQILLPNPMIVDKSFVRLSVLPSLISVYEYNKARSVKDVFLYEIAKTYDKNYNEDVKIGILMKGSFIKNEWQGVNIQANFYVIKGIVENLLNYLGFKNRYAFKAEEICDLHPGISARIYLDREEIGIIGRVHPSYKKDDIYVCELSMTKLYQKTIKPLKYKEANKYPEITKDVAFIMDEKIESETIKTAIKRAGGQLLDSVKEFDVYMNVEPGKKSIAYSLLFKDPSRTLSEDEVMKVFNNIISQVCQKLDVKLRG